MFVAFGGSPPDVGRNHRQGFDANVGIGMGAGGQGVKLGSVLGPVGSAEFRQNVRGRGRGLITGPTRATAFALLEWQMRTYCEPSCGGLSRPQQNAGGA